MKLTNRAKRRAKALAKQINDAGDVYTPCNCGLSGCYYKATRKSVAQKIIDGQRKTLKLDQATIDYALQMVTLV